MCNNNTHNRKNEIRILTIITASIIFSIISSQLTLAAFGAKSNAGFQDGLSDCESEVKARKMRMIL